MPNRPISSRSLTMFDVILCMTLAQRIHGTDEAIRAVAYRCRDKVQASMRPWLSAMMRHPKISEWLRDILKEID